MKKIMIMSAFFRIPDFNLSPQIADELLIFCERRTKLLKLTFQIHRNKDIKKGTFKKFPDLLPVQPSAQPSLRRYNRPLILVR